MPLGGVQVGSYDTYERAQAAVDYLSDEKFPVENVTIIGTDLRMIETVTGRLTMGRAIAAGAAGGSRGRLAVVLGLTVAVLVAEAVGALVSGSLALLADAGNRVSTKIVSGSGQESACGTQGRRSVRWPPAGRP